jgi:hypothetical protein
MTKTILDISKEESIAIDKLLLKGKKIPAIKLLIDTIGGHVGEVKVDIEARQSYLCKIGLAEMAEEPPGARYCVATDKGVTWLNEHGEEPHPKRHFYLYAKGFYEKSEDILSDLKKITQAFSWTPASSISDSDLVIVLGEEVFKNFHNHCDFISFLNEASPTSVRNVIMNPGEEISYTERIVRQMLIALHNTKIRDKDGYLIINLGEPDPEILPVRVEMINGVMVNKDSVVSRIFAKGEDLKTYDEHDITDEEGNIGTDVRLQIHEDWELHFGASCFDQDHRGVWGAGWVPRGCTIEEAREIANDLVDQAADMAAQAKL